MTDSAEPDFDVFGSLLWRAIELGVPEIPQKYHDICSTCGWMTVEYTMGMLLVSARSVVVNHDGRLGFNTVITWVCPLRKDVGRFR